MTIFEFIEDLSHNLRNMMERRNISQSQLSRMTGIDRTTINKYVNGVHIPPLQKLANICWALECDLSDIVDTWDYIDE